MVAMDFPARAGSSSQLLAIVGSSCGSQVCLRGDHPHALLTASAAPGGCLAMVLHTMNESFLLLPR